MKTVSPFSVNHASDYSRGQSIWRGAGLIICSLKGLREQEEMLGGGVGWGGVGFIYDGLASYSRGEGSLQYSQTPCATETEMSFNNSK